MTYLLTAWLAFNAGVAVGSWVVHVFQERRNAAADDWDVY